MKWSEVFALLGLALTLAGWLMFCGITGHDLLPGGSRNTVSCPHYEEGARK